MLLFDKLQNFIILLHNYGDSEYIKCMYKPQETEQNFNIIFFKTRRPLKVYLI